MSEKEKKVSIQKFTKIFLGTLFLIVLIMSLWIIVDCFKKTPDRTETVANYSSKPTVDYKVYLKPNKFYEQKYLTKGKKYISNIIDYIEIEFNYLFSSSKPVNYTYTYKVDADVSSQYELNGSIAELWKKNYNLLPSKTVVEKGTNVKTSEKIRIDYAKYDSLAKGFREEYGVVAETKLTVSIDLSLTGKYESDSMSEAKTITLTIPLNKAVTDVSVLGDNSTTKDITRTVKGETNVNYVLLVPAIILALVSAPLAAITFYKLFKITNVSQYIIEQKKILKGYGDIIAEVTTKPDLQDLKIVEVKNFEDLLNIEEELRVPIIFYELSGNDESWFIITSGTQAYRYILKSNIH
ncbi:MAG: DUF5305 domain-containing protein, partial [Bacilli bacterium]|nr:DUF5305 domain-containing protein [Bacilli bacterium]